MAQYGECVLSSVFPEYVRSGEGAADGLPIQVVPGVTPGVTYRLTVWGKLWSGYTTDRST